MSKPENVVTVTVSAPVGSGKSAIMGEIEIAMTAIGVRVTHADEVAGRSERNMTHADWQSALDMYHPRVVLVEHNSGTSSHWDAWYAGLPSDLTRRLSLHDFKRLGQAFKAAFLLDFSNEGVKP